jgi:hypothetical protein
MFKKIENKTLKAGILETIYYWNKSEYFYNKYFSQIKNIFKSESNLTFLANKIFPSFLSEYGVRRNLPQGPEIYLYFLKELEKSDFFNRVALNDISVIDEISEYLKSEKNLIQRNTKSLLSKFACLINPNYFFMMDSFAKLSIKKLCLEDIKKIEIDEYSKYHSLCLKLSEEIDHNYETGIFQGLLRSFPNSPAHDYFGKNMNAFKYRTVDKILWITSSNNSNILSTNDCYLDFYSELNDGV